MHMGEDEELFEAALADEQGRFAPKVAPEGVPPEAPPQPAPEPEPARAQEQPKPDEPREPHGIPPWRLKEEADARRAAEDRARQYEQEKAELLRQIAQAQQSKQKEIPLPNAWEDPDGYAKYFHEQQVAHSHQARMEARFEISETLMRDKMGDAKFEELKQWSLSKTQDPAFEAKMMTSKHPWGEASRLYEQERVLSQVGSDPNAWFEKQLEDRLKDPTHQAKLIERIRGNVQPQRPPVTQLPPSLNKAAAAASFDADGDDDSEAGLLKAALRR